MKIVICGGGTAGWLAALMIRKIQQNHDVVVIESSRIGIVGAGEGSTGYLTDIIQGNTWDYGCNEQDFLKETNATVKLGIKHRDWRTVGHTYYGPIDSTDSGSARPDVMLLWALYNNYPTHLGSKNGQLIEKNSSSFYRPEHVDPAVGDNIRSHAYHFDAHLVGQYFKKIVTADGVNTIDAEILQVNQNDHGITSLLLSNGQTVDGDFFIDCTGFARLLMKELGVKWHSYSDHLPVNTAMPFLLPYDDNETVEPVTTAWAQTAGWMWQIPVTNRYGCGYVFCDQFKSHDQAHHEIETALGKKIDPIRFLKFDTGRLDRAWHKNCLALGLCAAFAEPLEATSIHSTIVQLNMFIWDYLRDTVDETVVSGSLNTYNRRTQDMYDDFKDFLVLHYQTQRRDSDFWKYVTSGATTTPFVQDVLSMSKHKLVSANDFRQFYGYAGPSLWNWVLAGLGHIDQKVAARELDFWSVDREFAKYRWDTFGQSAQMESEKMYENTEFVRKH